jgi:hypothetical protein
MSKFAIVPVPDHTGPARDFVQADSILIGDMAEAMLALKDSVSAKALLRRLDESERAHAAVERTQAATRIANCAMLVDGLDRLSARLDSYEAELAIKHQRAIDEQEREEQERIERALDALPDPDDPSQHYPSGELHSLPAVPVQDQGDLPNELQEGAPPHSGNFTEPDPDKLAHPYDDPKQVNQPTAVSLW